MAPAKTTKNRPKNVKPSPGSILHEYTSLVVVHGRTHIIRYSEDDLTLLRKKARGVSVELPEGGSVRVDGRRVRGRKGVYNITSHLDAGNTFVIEDNLGWLTTVELEASEYLILGTRHPSWPVKFVGATFGVHSVADVRALARREREGGESC